MEELSIALKVCAREIRSEIDGVIPWALDASGLLDLPAELLQGEDTATGQERSKRRPDALPPLELAVADIPSSTTLTRSGTFAADAALAGGGMLFVGGIVAVLVLLLGLGIFAMTREPVSTPVTVVVPEPPPPPTPEPADVPTLVELVSEPEGAEVLKNGVLIGVAPLTIDLKDGPATLTVRMEGFEDRSVLLDGTVNRALVPLKAVPKARRPPPATPKPEVAPQPIATPVLPKSDLRNPFAD